MLLKSTELIHVFATIKANSGILLAFFAVKSTATRPLCVLVEKCGHSVNKPFTYLVYLLTYKLTCSITSAFRVIETVMQFNPGTHRSRELRDVE